MQNRYTGDIGDFSKLGLLRRLSNAGFTIGLNWYLTPNEIHNEDGKHIEYLYQPEQYRFLDSQLFDELKRIIDSERREIVAMEKPEILKAEFFSEFLAFPPSSRIREVRCDWHTEVIDNAITNAESEIAGGAELLDAKDALTSLRRKDI